MIQANLLLATSGKSSDSFVTLDLMRLPLGILSGMGFIGGGEILKHDNLVMGVTTAATLLFVTVLGLCIGGGQIRLGLTALGIGMTVLWVLRQIEVRMPHDRQGMLTLTTCPGGPLHADLSRIIRSTGYQILTLGVTVDSASRRREYTCELGWRAAWSHSDEPAFLSMLEQQSGVLVMKWNPQVVSTGLSSTGT